MCGIGALLVYISPFFDNTMRFQGWHDKFAETVVIYQVAWRDGDDPRRPPGTTLIE